MKPILILLVVAVFTFFVLVFLFVLLRRRVRPEKFKNKWAELQKYCASKETWPLAVITADKLLDEALKKKRLKGKSMGERLVAAQNHLTDNDAVWFAHNLSKKLIGETAIRLTQADVKRALTGFRQALKDLEVLRDNKK